MEDIKMFQDVLICDCTSAEHQIILGYFEPDDEPVVYLTVHLSKKPFWERVKHAVKYIFGYKCTYGSFDETIIGPEHVEKLQAAIDHITKTDFNLKLKANLDASFEVKGQQILSESNAANLDTPVSNQ